MSDAPLTTPRSMVMRKLSPDAKGAQGFLEWLQASMPAVYQDLKPELKKLQTAAAAQSLNGLGAFGEMQAGSSTVPAGSSSASSSWTDTVGKLIQAWGQYKLTDQQLDTMKQITNANLQRAQQGLAPLPYDAAEMGLAPTVQVGLTGSTSTMLMIGGGALLLMMLLSGRRRA